MKVDVLVIGAGAAGSAAAATIAPHGKVALIDATIAPPWRIGETLPGAARRPLAAIGAWDAFCAAGHDPAPVKLSRWGDDGLTALDCFRDPDGAGWRVDRSRFERDLRENAVQRGALLLVPARVRALHRTGSQWHAQVDRHGMIHADWIVDATGRSSRLLRPFGQTHMQADQLACTYQLVKQSGDDTTSYVHAVSDGWWYSAVVPGGHRLVAFHGDSDLGMVQQIFDRKPLWMAAQLPGFAEMLATIDPATASAPALCAAFSSARSAVGDGWLAVGDAAMSFDPLSSQGLFNALVTGIEGGRALIARLSTKDGADPASGYADMLGAVWHTYRRHHALYYGMEARWADQPFWRRRRADHPVSGDTRHRVQQQL